MRVPSRNLTAAERRMLLRLKREMGEMELVRQVRLICREPTPKRGGRKVGADSYKIDGDILPWLDILLPIIMREKELEPLPALRWFFGAARKGARLGIADDSMARRLYHKWRAGKFRKLKLPAGIDPSKFTLKPIE